MKKRKAKVILDDEPRLLELPLRTTPLEPLVKGISRPLWTGNKAKLIERYLMYFVYVTKHGTYICQECKGKYAAFPNIALIRRFRVLCRDRFTCRYCGRSPLTDFTVQLHIDHIRARARNGTDEETNYVTACIECNTGKLDYLLEEFQTNVIRGRNGWIGKGIDLDFIVQRLHEVADLQKAARTLEDNPILGNQPDNSETGEPAKTPGPS